MGHSRLIWAVYLLVLQTVVNATIEIIDSYHRTVDYLPDKAATNNQIMEGFIESANPPDACTNIASPTTFTNTTMKRMVLVNGTSECDFRTKVHYAETAGYDVAVLFDPFPAPFEYHNITFPIPRSELNLSVVLVLFEDGVVIRNNYLYQNLNNMDNFIIRISPNWSLETFLVEIFLGVILASMTFCVCVFLYAIYDWLRGKCCNWNEEENDEPENAEQNIEEWRKQSLQNLKRRFPSKEFSKDDVYDLCSICMCNYKVGEKIRELGCSHAFHSDCIEPWLLHHSPKKTCPLCVRNVYLENSCEQSNTDPSEATPLLASTSYGMYAPPRLGDGGGPSNALGVSYENALLSSDGSTDLMAEAQGSVNATHLDESGGNDQQGLLV